MIGRISGKIVHCAPPELLVEAYGIGYEVFAPMTTFFVLPNLGEQVTLHTHFAVSETSQTLYGFIAERDRSLFKLLIKVSGVGPKMAIGIMSLDTDSLVSCILEENISALVKVPGVGKKTAERLIVEMRDKLKGWSVQELGGLEGHVAVSPQSKSSIVDDAESALVALGYKPTEASKMVSRVYTDAVARSEDLIRLALKSLLPGK